MLVWFYVLLFMFYFRYAELRAANSYDMFLNLSTTRTDDGWMYFKINNDNFSLIMFMIMFMFYSSRQFGRGGAPRRT